MVPLVWIGTTVSFLFLYPATYNLLEIPAVLKPQVRLYATGIIRISRHPQAVGQILWCITHALWIGSSFMVVTCIGLIGHHLFAVWHGDQRLKSRFGAAFDDLKATTSVIPSQQCWTAAKSSTGRNLFDRPNSESPSPSGSSGGPITSSQAPVKWCAIPHWKGFWAELPTLISTWKQRMPSAAELAWLIPVLPLLGAVITGLGLISFNRTVNRLRKPVALLLISCVGAAAVLSYAILASQLAGAAPVEHLFIWASAGSFTLPMGYVVDPLGAVMLALVTTIALLVMVYSHGYMAHDKGYVRFFTYLALFSSSMLGLIISPNLLEIYVFWELVGMCSYLLVGFWYDRDGAARAAQKAFVVNRVGDFGLLLGILGLFWATGSFDFQGIADGLQQGLSNGSVAPWAALLLCLLVFMGPMAKSAQFPLHVWLPDAMEGPHSDLSFDPRRHDGGRRCLPRRPSRPPLHPVPCCSDGYRRSGNNYLLPGSLHRPHSDGSQERTGLQHCVPARLHDAGHGLWCPSGGHFHLVTHAFFKAMLFLGSGSVIHAMEEVVVGHEPVLAQDMRLMGGLRKKMPVTSITFLIGCVAISGIPPLAGFWSKDEILGQAFNSYPLLWLVGFLHSWNDCLLHVPPLLPHI